MYEAWARNWPAASGAMGWMLNSAWPSMIWQMVDYYNIPVGAFYGVQKACEPLHVQCSYDDASVWAINVTGRALHGATVRAAAYGPDGRLLEEQTRAVTLPSHGRTKAFVATVPKDVTGLYFLQLTLESGRRLLARNLYWLSTQMDEVERTNKSYDASHFKAQKSFADFGGLARLAAARVENETRVSVRRSGRLQLKTRLRNTSDRIAFFLRVQARSRKTGELVGPVTWNENCITLMPWEEATLVGIATGAAAQRNDLSVEVVGWNSDAGPADGVPPGNAGVTKK